MESEDGQVFIKQLAYFVRTHEKALANALQASRPVKSSHGHTSSASLSSPALPYAPSSIASMSMPYMGFPTRQIKPAKLTLTPHHLYYLLTRFSEHSIAVGPMDIRLESVNSDSSPANYVSFLNEAQRRKIRSSDRDSVHSHSSMRSVMSSMSSIWRTLGLSSSAKSQARFEKQQQLIKEDLIYLYSAFTKIPCLRLSPDSKAPLIAGYEEFPFDSAVPLFVFKNVTALEICDLDFRSFCGWDKLADSVRSLTLKRANIEDPADLLINIVLDDMDKRRKRSAKGNASPILGWPAQIQMSRKGDLAASPDSPPTMKHILERTSNEAHGLQLCESQQHSSSPARPSPGPRQSSRQAKTKSDTRVRTPKARRSSGSSGSSVQDSTPRGSCANLLSFSAVLPMSKWRFLRHLSLAENGLAVLPASSLSPLTSTLQSLDLSSNLFTEIPDSLSTLVALRALNLSNCMITSVRSLSRSPLPAITALNLRANRLKSISGIERLPSLERIDLRENEMTDPAELARLTGTPNLTDLYIHRNPFTKTHPEHRITIFNLFRKTPGYVEDIFLDGAQPTYSEKKSLIDRAPEMAVVSVPHAEIQASQEPELLLPIRSHAEPVIEPFVDPFYEQRKSQELLRQQRRKSDFGISTSQRRKRASRRRVVELAEAAPALESRRDSTEIIPPSLPLKHSLTDDSTYGGSEAETTPRRPMRSGADVPGKVTTPPPQLPPIETSGSPLLLRTGNDSMLSAPGIDGEVYRQRIENLRNDFGTGWLSALSDQPWDSTTQTNLNSSLQSVRTPSQGIVSGGRTLG